MHKGKYSRYLSDGSENPAFKNTVAMLTLLLGDETQPKSDRARAAEILKWSVERAQRMDSSVAHFLDELDCTGLWEWPDCFVLRDVERNGKIAREVVCIKVFANVPAAKPSQASNLPDESEEI